MSVALQRTKRRQQREETRTQILRAAQRFLEERSFREISVDSLMAGTGHTRTVFYRHFDDIPALILALMAEVGGELVQLSEQWERTERVSPEDARARLTSFVDFYVRNGRLVRAVAQAAQHDELVQDAYNGMLEGFMTLTTRAIEERVARGELEPLDAPEVARALVWMLNGYLTDRLGGSAQADPERVLETAWTIWTRTLFPKG
jgi:TetR/AcrR family transcriptional regulator, ethionamide resistance regulator